MIQRIQSAYLLLGALFVGALPYVQQVAGLQTSYTWFTPALWGLGGLTALVALWAIFLYNNRKFQRRVILWVQLLAVLLLAGLLAVLVLSDQLQGLGAGGLDGSLAGVLLLPVAAYLFFFLARRAVDKDIALVASMDRIR